MSHIERSQVTLFSGPVIERDGSERVYVGAYVPEVASSRDKMRVQECIGFLAVPNFDPTMYPQPRDGWVVRPARVDEATIEDVATSVLGGGHYEHQSTPIPLPVLENLVGQDAIIPPHRNI